MKLEILLQRGLSKDFKGVHTFGNESNMIYLTDTQELVVLKNGEIVYLKGKHYMNSFHLKLGEIMFGFGKCCVGADELILVFEVDVFTNGYKTLALIS